MPGRIDRPLFEGRRIAAKSRQLLGLRRRQAGRRDQVSLTDGACVDVARRLVSGHVVFRGRLSHRGAMSSVRGYGRRMFFRVWFGFRGFELKFLSLESCAPVVAQDRRPASQTDRSDEFDLNRDLHPIVRFQHKLAAATFHGIAG